MVIGSILRSTKIILEFVKVEDVESTPAPRGLPSIQIGLESIQTGYEEFILVTKKKKFRIKILYNSLLKIDTISNKCTLNIAKPTLLATLHCNIIVSIFLSYIIEFQ